MMFFFKQKTAYEMRISDWSSDVCSSDLQPGIVERTKRHAARRTGHALRHGQCLLCAAVGDRQNLCKARCQWQLRAGGCGAHGRRPVLHEAECPWQISVVRG